MSTPGYVFSPTQDQAQQAKTGQVEPPPGGQQTLRTLNFKLPNSTGEVAAASTVPGAISPLIGAPSTPQASAFGSAVLQSVLRTILGPDHANLIASPGTYDPADRGRAENGPQDYASTPSPFTSVQDRSPYAGRGQVEGLATTITADRTPTNSDSGPGAPSFSYAGSTSDSLAPDAPSGTPDTISAPAFGRGSDTFGGSFDREALMNARPWLTQGQ